MDSVASVVVRFVCACLIVVCVLFMIGHAVATWIGSRKGKRT